MVKSFPLRFSSTFPVSSSLILIVFLLPLLLFIILFTGCKGKHNHPPANIGGGFTLIASGGTLNDGSVAGLTVLATLRDAGGNGPGGAAGWHITITGPGIDSPLVVSYDDGSPSSYATWWWESISPRSGIYTATASNGTTTLTYNFSIDASKNLSQPTLNKSGDIITWNALPGAGSYYYRVRDGSGFEVLSGYYGADPLYSSYWFNLPVLTDGSYVVEIFAHTTNRMALQNDISSSPSLAAQENISLASLDIVAGGSGSGYSLDVRGGVLYEGTLYSDQSGTADYYGLVIWTSLLTNTTTPSAPASDWNITITGSGITTPISFTYPATNAHYTYWDFGAVPGSGTYIVSAVVSGGTASVTETFTIPSPTAKLPVATGLTAIPASGGAATLSWSAVPGANSYYVNVWTCVGAGSVNSDTGCTNNGTYAEIAANWVNTASTTIQTGTLTNGTIYDVYVTACEQDMTDMTTVPPADPGLQVDMSDTTFAYGTFTAL